MDHLSTEILARLTDGLGESEEFAHVKGCDICAAEFAGLKEQTEALGALPAVRPPKGDWEAVEARLISEGLVRDERWTAPAFSSFSRPWVQVAAALVLFLAGTGLGVGFFHGPAEFSLANIPGGELAILPVSQIRDVNLAAEAVRATEQLYMEKMLRFQQLQEADLGNEVDLRALANRYAALEGLVAASRAAVREAPSDPFINGILVSAMAERQAAESVIRRASDDNWF